MSPRQNSIMSAVLCRFHGRAVLCPTPYFLTKGRAVISRHGKGSIMSSIGIHQAETVMCPLPFCNLFGLYVCATCTIAITTARVYSIAIASDGKSQERKVTYGKERKHQRKAY